MQSRQNAHETKVRLSITIAYAFCALLCVVVIRCAMLCYPISDVILQGIGKADKACDWLV